MEIIFGKITKVIPPCPQFMWQKKEIAEVEELQRWGSTEGA